METIRCDYMLISNINFSYAYTYMNQFIKANLEGIQTCDDDELEI